MGSAAEQSKADGNAAFKLQHYPLALSHYSTAIQLDPSISTYPLNRSLVHLKLSNWKDAEKDAKRALELDGGVNVKALFRRGLARKGMGKLEDAKKDFEEAIGQGAGQDVQAELAKVKLELALDAKGKSTEKTKVSTSTYAPSPALSTPQPKPSTATQSKSDRLRAAIASPSSTPSSKSSSTPTSTSQTPSPSNSSIASKPSSTAAIQSEDSGFMKAVSTRKLKPTSTPIPTSTPSQSPPNPISPETTAASTVSEIENPQTAPKSTPSTSALPPPIPSTSSSPPSTSSSFAAKKLTRSSRQPSFLPPSSTSSTSSLPLRQARPIDPSSSTLTSLESSLLSLPASSAARKNLLRSLDPKKLIGFMGDSLTPDLLSLILAELDSQDQGEEEVVWKFELVEALSGCRRFEVARMMLGEEEVGVVRRVLEGMEKRVEGTRGRWEV
ncbi:hypothetical protein JCM5353_003381 [Sporobolomyces roseus]